ncbi:MULTISPECIES: divergent polysaccharide deacetylase family protein [unclassified Oleiphilus]|nr:MULTISPECIES: divergent polysaccharide deacetylase family protein [unclassified Oleiphilus]
MSNYLLKLSTVVTFILTTVVLAFPVAAELKQQPTIAIVIDDMGNHLENGSRLIDLPYPLTLSFLPERRHTRALIERAKENGKEIMLHSPMQNKLGIKLGKGGLTESMSEMQIKQTLRKSFISIPHMVGLNNHMGSQLTTQNKVMEWVMETVKQHPFFFLDSRTSANSVAAKIAAAHQIPNISRDVFLDHFQTRKFVQAQFIKLVELAKKNGTAIAIAHPHKVTVEYLSWALTKLDEKGISIASASAIWQIQNPGQSMQNIFAARNKVPRLAQSKSSTSDTLKHANYSPQRIPQEYQDTL